jgi:hypothetical protein
MKSAQEAVMKSLHSFASPEHTMMSYGTATNKEALHLSTVGNKSVFVPIYTIPRRFICDYIKHILSK